jgi:hypothetical protein
MAHSVKHYFNLFVNKDASMKASCVIHPDCEPMIIVRKWQLDFCNGNKSAAALLSFFEYWHNIKLEQSQKAKFQNSVANLHHDIGCQDESLYQFHTMDELEHGVLLYSRDAINVGLKILVDKKVISIHKNPNPKYSFDRTRYFLFYPAIVNTWLVINRFDGKQSIVGNPNIDYGNPQTVNGKPTTVRGKSDDRDMENRQTITEITSKTTSEITNNKNNQTSILEIPPEPEIKPVSCNNSGVVAKNSDPVFDYNDFDDIQVKAIEAWFIYRKEAKKTYKTKSSLTALRNKMLELKVSGLLIEAINHSIAMEYTGLFPPNNAGRYAPSHSPPKKQFNYVHDFTNEKPGQQVDTF